MTAETWIALGSALVTLGGTIWAVYAWRASRSERRREEQTRLRFVGLGMSHSASATGVFSRIVNDSRHDVEIETVWMVWGRGARGLPETRPFLQLPHHEQMGGPQDLDSGGVSHELPLRLQSKKAVLLRVWAGTNRWPDKRAHGPVRMAVFTDDGSYFESPVAYGPQRSRD